MKNNDEKYKNAIENNTFFFYNKDFEEECEANIYSIKELLLNLKNDVTNNGLKKSQFENIIRRENGIRALLALTGFSNEYLKRLISFIRIIDDPELNELVHKEKWHKIAAISQGEITEWTEKKIQSAIKDNVYFRKGLINLFFEGSSLPILAKALPLFELKKLSISKLKFDNDAMIDTLIRYKEKGSYSASKGKNPETLIEQILDELKITFKKGDLQELITNAQNEKRTMDFIIPNKENPRVIIECSFLVTTSSGQGDKSKTEINIDSLIKTHYPNADFIGFIDGIGWYVRKGDLKRMVSAYADVFTFHESELKRFKTYITDKLKIDLVEQTK